MQPRFPDLRLEKVLTPEKLTEDEAHTFAAIGRGCLHWFCVFVCGHDKLTPVGGVHWDFCRQLTEITRPQLHLKYRGFYKSTIIERDQPLWRTVRDPVNYDCLLMVDDEPLGLSHLHSIARQVEHNLVFQRLYPEIRPQRGEWGAGSYRISARDVSLEGPTWLMRTTRQPSTGRHMAQVILADWVHEQNWTSRTEQDRLKRHLDAIWPTLDADLLHLDGTRWADFDFWGYAIEQLYPDYLDVFIQPVRGKAWLDPEGKLVWHDDGVYADPWAWNDERWERERRRVSNPTLFAAQYTLDPRPKDEASFRPEWIERISAPALPPVTWYLAGDPASGEGSSRPALAVAGMSEEGKVYLAYVHYVPGLEADFIEQFFALARQWKPLYSGSERYGHGGWSVWQQLEAHMRLTNEYLTLEPLTGSGGDKDSRIHMTLWPLYQRGRIIHLLGLAGGDFEDELDAFPHGKYKDCCDAAAWAVSLALKYGYRGPSSKPRPPVERPDPLGVPRGYTLEELTKPVIREEDFREVGEFWL